MSDLGLRAVSFGTPDGSLWAAVVADDRACALALGGGSGALRRGEGLSWTVADADADADGGGGDDAGDGTWRLAGDGVSLEVIPVVAPPVEPQAAPPGAAHGEPPAATASVPSTSAPGQRLCRVRGTVTLEGGERALDCVGTRVVMPAAGDRSAAGARSAASDRPASARLMSAWFSDAEALTLLAVRAAGAEDHAGDRVAATLFDADGWIAVRDPRLSTTYDAAGRPTRATLELWIGEGEDEFPRRAAGEASGPVESVAGAGLALTAAPLRCHSRGQDGAGVYALVTW